jgi:hypothetical protein
MGVATSSFLILSPSFFPGLIRREQDNVWTSGIVLKDLYAQWVDNRKIVAIGDPLADRAKVRRCHFMRTDFLRTNNIVPDLKVIGLLSSVPDHSSIFPEDLETLFRSASKCAKELGVALVVKCHPLQSENTVQRWMRQWHCNGLIIRNCDLFDFSLACDLIFAPYTTAVWQAMLAGTPVVSTQRVVVELDQSLNGMGFCAAKGIVHLDSEALNYSLITALIDEKSAIRRDQIFRGFEHVQEHVGPLDGGSGNRMMIQINDEIKAVDRRSPISL